MTPIAETVQEVPNIEEIIDKIAVSMKYITSWHTYKNEKYGFEFKYPKDWGDVQESNDGNKTFSFLINEDTEKKLLIEVTSDMSWKDFYKFSPGEIKDIEIAGKKWPAVYFSGGDVEESGYWPPSIKTAVYNNRFVYKISLFVDYEVENNLLKSVLSSFSF